MRCHLNSGEFSYEWTEGAQSYYKHLLVLLGDSKFELHFNQDDRLSPSQQAFAESQLNIFQTWWSNWAGKTYHAKVAGKNRDS